MIYRERVIRRLEAQIERNKKSIRGMGYKNMSKTESLIEENKNLYNLITQICN